MIPALEHRMMAANETDDSIDWICDECGDHVRVHFVSGKMEHLVRGDIGVVHAGGTGGISLDSMVIAPVQEPPLTVH